MPSPNLPALPSVTFDGYELDVDYYLKRDYDDIAEAGSEIPALLEWLSSILQGMMEEKILAKQAIKEAEALSFRELAASPDFIGKKTEANLARAVTLDESVRDAYRNYARLSGWVSRLFNLRDALQAKLDLQRSIESTRRKIYPDERETDEPI